MFGNQLGHSQGKCISPVLTHHCICNYVFPTPQFSIISQSQKSRERWSLGATKGSRKLPFTRGRFYSYLARVLRQLSNSTSLNNQEAGWKLCRGWSAGLSFLALSRQNTLVFKGLSFKNGFEGRKGRLCTVVCTSKDAITKHLISQSCFSSGAQGSKHPQTPQMRSDSSLAWGTALQCLSVPVRTALPHITLVAPGSAFPNRFRAFSRTLGFSSKLSPGFSENYSTD